MVGETAVKRQRIFADIKTVNKHVYEIDNCTCIVNFTNILRAVFALLLCKKIPTQTVRK